MQRINGLALAEQAPQPVSTVRGNFERGRQAAARLALDTRHADRLGRQLEALKQEDPGTFLTDLAHKASSEDRDSMHRFVSAVRSLPEKTVVAVHILPGGPTPLIKLSGVNDRDESYYLGPGDTYRRAVVHNPAQTDDRGGLAMITPDHISYPAGQYQDRRLSMKFWAKTDRHQPVAVHVPLPFDEASGQPLFKIDVTPPAAG